MLLDQLRRLLAETGRLTQKLVNDDPNTCNATIFQRRFGGMVPAFELVGYKPSYHQLAMRAVRLRQPKAPWSGPRFPLTNEAIMDGLRDLLVRHGRLTAQLIDLDPDLPSTTTCRDRLGGLDRIYQALGYEPSAQQMGRFRASPRVPVTIVDAAPVILPGTQP